MSLPEPRSAAAASVHDTDACFVTNCATGFALSTTAVRRDALGENRERENPKTREGSGVLKIRNPKLRPPAWFVKFCAAEELLPKVVDLMRA